MYDYKLLEAFTAVIDNKGFDKAAQVLYITQSAVSQRIKQLEETLGQIILVRGTPPTPTEAGRKIIAHFNKVKLLESELSNDIEQNEVRSYTTVPIGLNADTLATWFFDAVGETILKNKILLDLHIDDQDETHRMLKDGDVAGCITTRDKAFQSCTCTYIGTMTYRMYCSAESYDKLFPDGLTTEALKDVPFIIYNDKDSLHLQMLKKAFGRTNFEYPKMYIPAVDQYLDAVLRGFGIGMMPDNQCMPLVERGLLKDVFAPHIIETPLYWHRWTLTSAPLDVLTKALTKKHLLI
ncbi:MAG: transcriptional regulator ArgP [Denitrovibrio sp.]|nr:MAG: transcriptional regulator ArgP [Denitrovibrio sp.]